MVVIGHVHRMTYKPSSPFLGLNSLQSPPLIKSTATAVPSFSITSNASATSAYVTTDSPTKHNGLLTRHTSATDVNTLTSRVQNLSQVTTHSLMRDSAQCSFPDPRPFVTHVLKRPSTDPSVTGSHSSMLKRNRGSFATGAPESHTHDLCQHKELATSGDQFE